MSIEPPKPIADYVAANARLDADAMLKPFAADAVFLDNGKRFEGHDQIRKLFEEEVIAVKAIFTPDTIRNENGQIVVEGPAHGTPAARFASPIVSRFRRMRSGRWRSRCDDQD